MRTLAGGVISMIRLTMQWARNSRHSTGKAISYSTATVFEITVSCSLTTDFASEITSTTVWPLRSSSITTSLKITQTRALSKLPQDLNPILQAKKVKLGRLKK